MKNVFKRIIVLLLAISFAALSSALPLCAFERIDPDNLYGTKYSVPDRKKLPADRYGHSQGINNSFTMSNSVIPEEEREKILAVGIPNGYEGRPFELSYWDNESGGTVFAQYGVILYAYANSAFESVITNAPPGINEKEGESQKSDEKPFVISATGKKDCSFIEAYIDPPSGVYYDKFYLKKDFSVEECTDKIRSYLSPYGGRIELGRVYDSYGGIVDYDDYYDFSIEKIDDERTLFSYYRVEQSDDKGVDKKTGKVYGYWKEEKWDYWLIYEPKDFPEFYLVIRAGDCKARIDYENPRPGSYPWKDVDAFNLSSFEADIDPRITELAELHYRQVDEVMNAMRTTILENPVIIATEPYTTDGVYKDIVVNSRANKKAGEDDGVSIPATIIIGVLGAGAAIAGTASGGDDDNNSSIFKMTFRKDFGDTLDRDGQPMPVMARIIEVKPDGSEVPRDDLTAQIEAFSSDESLIVKPYGMQDGYASATVQVPPGTTYDEAILSFRLQGKRGSLTRNIIFKIDEARIVFMQENLGLPAKYDKESKLPFVLVGLPENAEVTAEIKCGENEDIYDLALKQDDEYKTLWYALIREKVTVAASEGEEDIEKEAKEEKPAGTTEAYMLHVTATCGKEGEKGYLKKEAELPILRIVLGLSLVIESTGIGCYMQLKPERVGIDPKNMTINDIQPCMTKASIMMLDWDEESHSIVRVALLPKISEEARQAGRGIPLKLTPKKVENDRYAHAGDADENHQKLIDALGISAFPTGETYSNGAYKLNICSTTGSLDAPTRLIAELEITATYKGKDYSVKKDVLLRSQELRVVDYEQRKNDQHIKERLEHIKTLIWNNYMDRLYSLYNLIDRMLDGFDERFGFDANQVSNVMSIWTGFIQGTHMGANGEGIKLTLADELKDCYAFMQGLRDNTGVLGRIAMGFMTAGYSEYVFTAMTLGEEMHERVMNCKGDEEFGTWDAVVMCVKEFEKQIIMEYVMMGAGMAAQQVAKKTGGMIDPIGWAQKAGSKYRATIDKWDQALCANSKIYKAGSDALNKTTNYFNSLARSAGNSINECAKEAEQAAAKAEQKIASGKQKLTPAEVKAIEEYDLAMAEGLNKVQKLKEAQQELARTKGAAKEAARVKYKKAANEVWTDKNALKQLQRSKDSYAKNMRYEFNQYREGVLNRVEQRALDDLSIDYGIPRDELYISNATGNGAPDYYNKIPNDRDTSINRIVKSDRSMDFTISQDWGEKAMARNLYKELNGVEPSTIEEALRFMKGKDVTYVCPEGAYYMNHVIEPNMDAYTDLAGMIGMTKNGTIDKSLLNQNLKGLELNQKTVAHKGKEWFTHDANESLRKAAECEKAAAGLSGAAKEAMLLEARNFRYTAIAQKVEGVRQITKQFDRIIDVRNTYSIARGNASAITPMVREIHSIAKRVGEDIPPSLFEKILHEQYGLTLDGYADMMSKCLV